MSLQQHVRTILAVAAMMGAMGVAAAQTHDGSATTPAPHRGSASPQSDLRATPVPPAIDAAFRRMDVDHDGSLSLPEFRNGWRKLQRRGRQTATVGLRAQFKRLDTNGNGGIDRTEYPNMVLVKRAGPLALPFSQVDRDNNQKLDFAEYTSVVRGLRAIPAGPEGKHK